MESALQRLVESRANFCCEYCRMPRSVSTTPFQIDHIIAKKHGGVTASDNLALSCFHCNVHKGPNIAGVDPDTGATRPLFRLRRDRSSDHFELRAVGYILAQTDIARTTLIVLNMNDPDAVSLRSCFILEGKMRSDAP